MPLIETGGNREFEAPSYGSNNNWAAPVPCGERVSVVLNNPYKAYASAETQQTGPH